MQLKYFIQDMLLISFYIVTYTVVFFCLVFLNSSFHAFIKHSLSFIFVIGSLLSVSGFTKDLPSRIRKKKVPALKGLSV